eukprot:469383_1
MSRTVDFRFICRTFLYFIASCKCNVDTKALEERILIAIAGDVKILSSEIKDDEVVVTVSITAESNIVLQTSRIEGEVEGEIKDDDNFGDVKVEETRPLDDVQNENEFNYITPLVASFSTLVICCCVVACIKRRKRKRINDLMTLEDQISKPGHANHNIPGMDNAVNIANRNEENRRSGNSDKVTTKGTDVTVAAMINDKMVRGIVSTKQGSGKVVQNDGE